MGEQLKLFDGSKSKTIELSEDQLEAYIEIQAWVEQHVGQDDPEPAILRLGGYAGTGKTTLLSKFAAETDLLVAYIAFTGRASSLMARKFKAAGLVPTTKTMGPKAQKEDTAISYGQKSQERHLPFVGTIHRFIYKPVIDPVTEELHGWAKRTLPDRKYDLIVVDEASMVGDSLLGDLTSFGIPILAVGDHGQLPPVMDASVLMKRPDVRLEKIHRQAKGSPIITLSKHVRTGGRLKEFSRLSEKGPEGDFVEYESRKYLDEVLREAYMDSKSHLDVAVICWMNKTRIKLNGLARRLLKFKGPPKKGEQVICLKNDPPIYNGMRGVLVADTQPSDKPWKLEAVVEFPEEGIKATPLTFNAAQFHRERPFDSVDQMVERGIRVESMSQAGKLYDFGYAMTCHKMQGSQASHVIVVLDRPEEPGQSDWRRFIYTAVTRATTRLTIVR